MTNKQLRSYSIKTLLLLSFIIGSGGWSLSFAQNYIEGEVIVHYKTDSADVQPEFSLLSKKTSEKNYEPDINLSFEVQSLSDTQDSKTTLIQSKSGRSTEELLNYFEAQDNVEYVQPNYRYEFLDDKYIPNDPWYWSGHLGWLDNIRRWETINHYSWSQTHSKWSVVAVIDLGVDYRHPDLINQMRDGSQCKTYFWTSWNGCQHGASFYRAEGSDLIINKDPLPEYRTSTGVDISSYNTHGTHIAWTIAAQMDNNIGIVGVNPQAKIMGIKAWYKIGNGKWQTFLTTDQIIKAIQFAQHNGADIINASFWAEISDTTMTNTINAFTSQWGIFITAAGNEKKSADTFYPCNLSASNPRVICVGAHNNTNKLDPLYSNYGDMVNISAPGTEIYSTVLSGSYGNSAGTSMAAPHVVWAFSLLRNYRPDLNADEIKDALYNGSAKLASGSQAIEENRRLDLFGAFKLLDNIVPQIDDITTTTNSDFCMTQEVWYTVVASDNIALADAPYSFDNGTTRQTTWSITAGTWLILAVKDHNWNILTQELTPELPDCPYFVKRTNTTTTLVDLKTNTHTHYLFSGDITTSISWSWVLANNTLSLELTSWDGEKTIFWKTWEDWGVNELYGTWVIILDTTPPNAEIHYSTTGLTNNNVTVLLTGISEEIIITNNDGNPSYEFSSNGTFTFQFKDLAGNTWSATATVNNIDKTPPTASIHYSTTISTNDNVTATLTGESKYITITNNDGSRNYIFTKNGSFTFQFRDRAGNIGSATATVQNIKTSSWSGGWGGWGGWSSGWGSSTSIANKNLDISDIEFHTGYTNPTPNTTLDLPVITDRQQHIFDDELIQAYLYAYQYRMTTINDIEQANLHNGLTRAQAAKILSNFAITILGRVPDQTRQCQFDDIDWYKDLTSWMKTSCQLGIMGVDIEHFNPNDVMTRAQLGTVLSRIIWGERYNQDWGNYYQQHLFQLQREGIMTQIENPSMQELRWRVMLMLYRTSDKLASLIHTG